MKRIIVAIVLILCILAVAAGLLLWNTGRLGTTGVEQWVGRQILAIANDALRPKLSFQTLDYEYPATATLHEVRLTDDETPFVTATSMRIVFTERPRRGRPIVIETIELTEPVVELRQRPDGSMVGFSDFIESTEGRTRADGGSTRPSDVFAIRTLRIIDGVFVYATPDDQAMRLDEITFDLTSSPDSEQGWYALDALLERAPVFTLALDGRLNIDTASLDLADTTLDVHLQPEQYELLPPQLQKTLNQHDIRGVLSMGLSGMMPLADPMSGDLDLHLLLTEARIAFGEYMLPIQSLETMARLEEQTIHIEPLVIAGLGGTLQATGDLRPVRGWGADLQLDARGVRIEQALRDTGEQPPRFAGRVDLDGELSGELADPAQSLAGTGVLQVTEARLVNLPVVGGLVRTVSGGKANGAGKDRLRADLQLAKGETRFRDIELLSAAVAARGEGEIGFDGRIDFTFNAGPLERVQGSLGAIGDLLGKMTDQLMKYHVTGPIGEPKFDIRPLGIGAD
ncbi:MAG: AsmA-like C-terminal region-containing protein [Planctomycetota bacterium]|nr:AsmA-like C-terminal region-containing protein [Planctomycetota bacterium]